MLPQTRSRQEVRDGEGGCGITERAYTQLLAPTIRRELFEAFAWELGREAASGVETAGTRSSLPGEVTRGRRHQAVA